MALTQVSSGLISSVANTAITGNIISSQITSVANTQITGLMTASQIVTVANTQVTGLITSAQIATVSNTQITGLVTSAQIATVANTQVTGIHTVAQGGTGQASLTANNVILGNGTNNVIFVDPGTSGNVLTSNNGTWISSAPTGGGGGGALATPTLTPSATNAPSGSTITVTIGNYNAAYAYIVAVDSGSYSRSANVISWTLPVVTSNVFSNMTVQAGYTGQVSLANTTTVSANISSIGTPLSITDFSTYSSNYGWAI